MKLKQLSITFVSILFLLLVGCNNNDHAQDNNRTLNENDTISSLTTDQDSENYPHTQPVKIQDAKYEFKIGQQGNFQQQQQGQQQQKQDQTNNTAQQQQQNTLTQNNGQAQANNNTQQRAQEQGDQQAPQQAEQQTQQNEAPQNNQNGNEFITKVIELTNAERQQQGLPALEAYPELNNVANEKARDMNAKGYFSHTSPTYGSPFDMMRDFGISYQTAGENIAQGQSTPEEVVEAWMNSEGHRANILSTDFSHIGVGYEQAGHQWVQMFIRK